MSDLPSLFIGSSSEALMIAKCLEVELDDVFSVERWDRDVFDPGDYSLDSLRATAKRVDYAVLIATPDDLVESRGETSPAPRDNVLLEFGMFVGVLGRERAFLLAAGEVRLPTDTLGLTRLSYSEPSDGNVRRALTRSVVQLTEVGRRLGPIDRGVPAAGASGSHAALEQEIELLCVNARAQGWEVRTNSATTLRLRSPKRKHFTLQKSTPDETRVQLRQFVKELRASGLRVNNALRRPVESSPL